MDFAHMGNNAIEDLVNCPNCYKVFKYYDYLSHGEVCNGGEVNNIDWNYGGNEYMLHENGEYESDDEREAEDELEYIALSRYNNLSSSLQESASPLNNIRLNGINDVSGRNLLEMSLIDDIMRNRRGGNEIHMMDIQMEAIMQGLNNVDIGLGKENLEMYGNRYKTLHATNCIICFNTYSAGEDFYMTKCMHTFCKECSERWFEYRSLCPLCNRNLKIDL